MTMITGLFKNKHSAERAFQSVIDLGYDKNDINVVMSDETRQRYLLDSNSTTVHPVTSDLEQKVGGDISNSASGKLGTPAGGTVGTLMPIVTAVGVALIPGLGIVAGPFAVALAAAAATGVAVGLVGILTKWNIPDMRIEQYEMGIRAGGILLGVKARTDEDVLEIQQRWQQGGGQHVHS